MLKPGNRIRIKSEGQSWKTEITLADSGEKIPGVRKAVLRIEAGKPNSVELEVLAADFEAVGEITVIKRFHPCPKCGGVVE